MARDTLAQVETTPELPPAAEGAGGEPGVAPPERPEAPGAGAGGGSLDLGLLAVFVVIFAVVAASNIWLRRRAEREKH